MNETDFKEGESPLEHLIVLRDTWSDEIPDRVIHSDSRIMSKARRNWFVGVVADVKVALDEGYIQSAEAREATEKLMDRFTSRKFIKQKLTKKEDIQEANRLIDVILGRH